jgi:hypothetical protein
MSFTVDDFEDLLRLLYERPEWQERLRRAILPPELFELPRLAQELADANRAERERVARLEAEQQATRQEVREGFAQTGKRLDRLDIRVAGVEGRVERVETDLTAFRADVDERFARVDERFDGVDKRFDRVDEHLDFLTRRTSELSSGMGDLKGRFLESEVRSSPLIFDHILPGATAISRADLTALLRAEVAAGRLQQGDAVRIQRADAVFQGQLRGETVYLVVEVSWLIIDASDIVRAVERAALLAKTGRRVLTAVAGRRIIPGVMELAVRRGVEVVVDESLDDAPRIDMDA